MAQSQAIQRGNASNAEVFVFYWVLIFLLIAVVAAVLGFTGIAVVAADLARIACFSFLVLFSLHGCLT